MANRKRRLIALIVFFSCICANLFNHAASHAKYRHFANDRTWSAVYPAVQVIDCLDISEDAADDEKYKAAPDHADLATLNFRCIPCGFHAGVPLLRDRENILPASVPIYSATGNFRI